MSRTDHRRSLSIAIAALAALVLPAAAQAADYTIQTGGGPCDSDLVCGSFAQAAAVAADGDTFAVKAGSYSGAATFASAVQITGDPGVILNGTLTFSDAGGLSTLRRVNVGQAGAAPAIQVIGAGGLALSDLTAVSGQDDGVRFTAGSANKIERSNIITAEGTKSAVRVQADATTVGLDIFSSFATGGASGIGVATGQTGTATVTARHVTAGGSGRGVHVDTRGPLISLGAGTINLTVTDSIILDPLVQHGLLATENISFDAASERMQLGNPDELFADPLNRNFRLKPSSPAIDAGGITVSESTTDFEGDPRPGPVTDLGADEYVNTPPKAAIAVKTKLPRDGQPVEFDGGGSRDQPGGSIAAYRWDFGDGTMQTTSLPTVTHVYKGDGPVTAKLTVVDGEGASSAPASTGLTILDGGAPEVVITKPKSKQKIKVFTTKTKTVTNNGVKRKLKTRKRTRIKFAGTATDKSGVARVVLTVQKTAAKGSQSTSAKCRWLDPKKGLRRTSCAKPILILVKVKGDGTWAYNVRKSIKLSRGSYRVIAYGLDNAGAFGNSAPKARRNIRFTLK